MLHCRTTEVLHIASARGVGTNRYDISVLPLAAVIAQRTTCERIDKHACARNTAVASSGDQGAGLIASQRKT